MPLPFTVRRTDPDAAAFCARSGASDRAAVSAFVRGVKDLGLWESMVCWPLRSSQNAGTGTTAYSLGGLGTFDGTLTNGPVWTADGITKANAIEQIDVTGTSAALREANSVFACFKSSADEVLLQRVFNCQGGTASSNYWQTQIGTTDPVFANVFETRNSVNNNPTGVSIAGRDLLFNFWGAARGSTTTRQFANGSAGAEQTGLSARNPTGTPNVDMIGTSGASGARGTLSFAIALTPTISSGDMSALYTLYKSTFGTGLGLP
jgi:hypothetical protein